MTLMSYNIRYDTDRDFESLKICSFEWFKRLSLPFWPFTCFCKSFDEV